MDVCFYCALNGEVFFFKKSTKPCLVCSLNELPGNYSLIKKNQQFKVDVVSSGTVVGSHCFSRSDVTASVSPPSRLRESPQLSQTVACGVLFSRGSRFQRLDD